MIGGQRCLETPVPKAGEPVLQALSTAAEDHHFLNAEELATCIFFTGSQSTEAGKLLWSLPGPSPCAEQGSWVPWALLALLMKVICCLPFSCTLILLSTFTLPPSPVVSTNTSAAACWTEWWMYQSSNYTSPYASNFKPYRVSDVAHGSCTSAYADKIGGSPRPGKKSQDRLGQIFLRRAKCCHSKCTRWSHGLRLLNFMQILTTIPLQTWMEL